MPKKAHSNGTRVIALYLLDNGTPHTQVTAKTGISRLALYALREKAIARGWRSKELIEVEHVEDAPRTGRPKASSALVEHILETVTRNSTTRQWSCARIAAEVTATPGWESTSASTVYRVLTDNGYGVFKRTVKPGLREEDKKRRLQWCLDHRWTLEEWKNVIFSDETSVVLGGVRGRRRVWRKIEETFHPHVVVRRWKGKQEFMWWSCFSYDKKGPYHIWEAETKAEKKAMEKDLEERNAARFEEDKMKWELENAMERIHITRNQPGRKAQFKHTEETGAYVVKDGKGGINWYRYQEKILKALLLPFAKECQKERQGTVVQEDNAPSHASKYQVEVFDIWEITRLLWPGNSPDLNPIEPCWFWMKRETTKKGPITSNKALKEAWIKCWQDLPQEKIQAWIKRLPEHIEAIIKCEGDNLYKEGRNKGRIH